MKPEILIEVQSSTIKRYAGEDLEFPISAPVFYSKGIVDVGNIQTALTEQFYGGTQINAITFTLDDSRGEIRALADVEEMRDVAVIIKKVDRDDDSISQTLTVKISSIEFKVNTVVFSCELKELDVWSNDVPVEKTTLEKFPNCKDLESIDVPIGTWFGYCRKIPLIYIQQDRTNDIYDYLIGFGTIFANEINKNSGTINVYREGVLVPTSEYTVYDGSQADPTLYPGYAFIRFILEQRDYSYNLYQMTADVYGLKIDGVCERNPARIYQEWLTNTTWGLGLTINVASFVIAISRCADMTGDHVALKLDGGFTGIKSAQEWNKEFIFATRLGQLIKNSVGEYELNIPIYQSTNDADLEEHDVVFQSDKRTSTENCIKKVKVLYQLSEGKFLKENEKDTGFTFGVEEREYPLEFIRDNQTADVIAQYLKNRFIECERVIKFDCGMNQQTLKIGNVVNLTYSQAGLSGIRVEISEISKGKNKIEISGTTYSANIFNYSPDYSTEDMDDDIPDYSKTNPDPVEDVSMIGKEEIGEDGAVKSWFEIQCTIPTKEVDDFDVINFLYANIYLEQYLVANSKQMIGVVSIEDYEALTLVCKFKTSTVIPGQQYKCWIESVNMYNLKSAQVSSNWIVALGDTTAPSNPMSLIATTKIAAIQLDWTPNTDLDLAHYNVYRDGSVLAEQHKSTTYTDNVADYDVNHSYKISAEDFSGNESGFSNNAVASARRASESADDLDLYWGTDELNTSIDVTSAGLAVEVNARGAGDSSLQSQITVQAGQIALKVSSTDYEPNDVAAKINSSSITITPANITLKSSGTITIGSGQGIVINAGGRLDLAGTAGIWLWGSSISLVGGSINLSSSGVLNITGSTVNVSGTSSININTGGQIRIDADNGIYLTDTGSIVFGGVGKISYGGVSMSIKPLSTGSGTLSLGTASAKWGIIASYSTSTSFNVMSSFDITCGGSSANILFATYNNTSSQLYFYLPITSGGGSKSRYRTWAEGGLLHVQAA